MTRRDRHPTRTAPTCRPGRDGPCSGCPTRRSRGRERPDQHLAGPRNGVGGFPHLEASLANTAARMVVPPGSPVIMIVVLKLALVRDPDGNWMEFHTIADEQPMNDRARRAMCRGSASSPTTAPTRSRMCTSRWTGPNARSRGPNSTDDRARSRPRSPSEASSSAIGSGSASGTHPIRLRCARDLEARRGAGPRPVGCSDWELERLRRSSNPRCTSVPTTWTGSGATADDPAPDLPDAVSPNTSGICSSGVDRHPEDHPVDSAAVFVPAMASRSPACSCRSRGRSAFSCSPRCTTSTRSPP